MMKSEAQIVETP